MKWTIYCHIHIESNRAYVGLTSQTIEKRWKTHVSHAKSSKGGRWHFPNAIRKYGKDAFSHRILEICDSLEKANYREEAWIELFESRDLRFGFNLAKGGGSQPHPIRKNPWNDPEYRRKCLPGLIARTNTLQARANNKAALNTPESRAKRAISSREVRLRPEVNAKIVAAHKGRKYDDVHCRLMSRIQIGKVIRPEVRLKIAQSMTKPEVREAIIASNKRRVVSDESRKKRTNTIQKKYLNEAPITSKLCSKHGVFDTTNKDECYIRMRNKYGRPTFECKKCVQESYRERRRKLARRVRIDP
jgi:group I intron endonuclease